MISCLLHWVGVGNRKLSKVRLPLRVHTIFEVRCDKDQLGTKHMEAKSFCLRFSLSR